MAGLLLWIPATELNKRAVDVFAAAGLADMLDPRDAQPAVTEELVAGPHGGRGMLWHWHADGDKSVMPIVRKEGQTWYECRPRGGLPKGRAWLGFETKNPPRPCDLERTNKHVGQPLTMADEQAWLVPLVRELPQIYCYDDAGDVATRFNVPRYQDLFDRTADWCERIHAASEGKTQGDRYSFQYDGADYFDYVGKLLGLNYRVNGDVVAALGFVATGDVGLIPFTAGGYLQPEKKS